MSEQLGFGPGDELSWMNTYFLIGKSDRRRKERSTQSVY